MEPKHDPTAFRVAMGLFGFAAGIALWALSEFVLNSLGNPRLELVLTAGVVAYFGPALLLSGPMTMPRALLWAFAPGLIAPALLLWSSLRFETLTEMSDSPGPFVAFFVLVLMSLPYLVALQRREPLNYVVLFNEAWRIVIRAVASTVFLAVFWGVYMISNLLLSLVGIGLLDELLDRGAFVFALTGLVVGLALSVLYEQRAYLSPVLLMRLLQLLLIPVTVVVLVFVLRVPVQGLDEAFSGLSAAATLMTMTFALATLISAALDCEFGDPPPGRLVVVSVQVASLLMPVLAVLAGIAIWERVGAYGWTPTRVAAAILCGVAVAYAFGYAGAVVMRGAWDARLRRVNVWIGLGILGLAVLSQTPLLDAERISARDQVTRYTDGRLSAENLPLFEMANRWGIAGRDALAELQASGAPEIAVMLDDLRETVTPGVLGDEPMAEQRAALERLLAIRPEAATWPEEFFGDLPDRYVSDWLFACRQGVGRCVAVVSDQIDAYPGPEAHVLIWTPFDELQGFLVLREPRGDLSIRPLSWETGAQPEEVMQQVLSGEYTLAPPSLPALWVGEWEFLSLPR